MVPPDDDGPERTAVESLDAERSARRVAEHALATVEALLASSAVGIGLIDTNLRYVRVNSVLAEINGVPLEEHAGRTVREILGASADRVEPYMRQVIETREPVTNLEQTMVPEGGSAEPRTFLVNFFPVRAQDDEVLGVGAAVADITRQKRVEAQLHEAIRQREEFLAVVSHDLRNPLGTIHMAAALLAEIVPLDDPRAGRSLEAIRRSVHRMERLIDDLLDLASIQSGRLSIERSSVDAQQLATEAFEANEPAARVKQITLERDTHLERVVLSCDRDRILQVLGNLLGNAIKFCAPGDRITLRAGASAHEVWFEVADTGPGISSTDLPHVFDPYWSAQPHARQGTGLGLYITKGIVEAHGGTLTAASTPSAGATFRFTLPRAAA